MHNFNFTITTNNSIAQDKKKSVLFSFLFVSLIAPNFINNFTLFLNPTFKYKKIQLKHSYILFTWFRYLAVLEEKNNKIKIFTLPLKKKISTHLKAPIAHKNWSKEQYLFQYYSLRVSFKNSFINNELPSTVNAGLLFSLITQKNLPIFETNIFFLKNYTVLFSIKDKTYFRYV